MKTHQNLNLNKSKLTLLWETRNSSLCLNPENLRKSSNSSMVLKFKIFRKLNWTFSTLISQSLISQLCPISPLMNWTNPTKFTLSAPNSTEYPFQPNTNSKLANPGSFKAFSELKKDTTTFYLIESIKKKLLAKCLATVLTTKQKKKKNDRITITLCSMSVVLCRWMGNNRIINSSISMIIWRLKAENSNSMTD